jgi:Carboxypeptidase regulatory-like domain
MRRVAVRSSSLGVGPVTCFPPCSPWCDCVNDVCLPSPVSINAVRLRTPDGRYLQAANGGGGLLIAASVAAANTWETFLFAPPAAWPLASGSLVSLDVCNANWDPAGMRVRVEHNTVTLPHGHKGDRLVTYEVGGAGTRVLVCGPFSAGYPAYPGDDPAERIFTLVKLVGGAPTPAGTPINSGDSVVVRIDSNRGKTFFFRVVGGVSGAEVDGDGLAVGGPGTVFIAEFNEVRSGLGWRPPAVQCQTCAAVTALVTRAAASTPIVGATAVAQVPNHPYQGTTGADGRAALVDTSNRNCVPAGGVAVQASANRYQDKTVSVQVPGSGAVEVPIALDCTQVKGHVVDTAGSGVPGVVVMLRDANGTMLVDENGNPFLTTTAADGSFVFNCVGHGFVQVWTLADPSQINHTNVIGPPGWTTVTITIQQPTCGNLVGKVIDAGTQAPIPGATVTESGGQQTTTDANGEFRFVCVRPAGQQTVFATAPGYQPGYAPGVVPTAGDSAAVIIKLTRVTAMEIQIRLDWGTQPSDLDSHLSGPDQAGGRFHCFFVDKTPVPYVTLDVDDVTAFGPETITIRRAPPTAAGQFVAGDYHYWVHNYTTTTFAGSMASVSIAAADSLGALTQIAHYDVVAATGDPNDDLWHVVDFTLDVNGTVVRTDVQTFLAGNSATVL